MNIIIMPNNNSLIVSVFLNKVALMIRAGTEWCLNAKLNKKLK